MIVGRCGIRPRRRLRKGDRLLDLLLHPGIQFSQFLLRGEPFSQQPVPIVPNRAAALPLLHFLLGAVNPRHRVAFVMTDSAVGLGFDQRWPLALAGPFYSLPRDFADGEDIVAVHLNAGQPVGGRTSSDRGRRVATRKGVAVA